MAFCGQCGTELAADTTAQQLVANITVGWNLGNTFDATDHGNGWMAGYDVEKMETAWQKHATTKANIDAVKNAGFNTIRIPVSWTKATDADYNICEDWMKRVKKVVDYAVDNDMYIILNTHHENHVFKFKNAEKTDSLKAFKKIWGQIAHTFKDYNEKLIFEGLNEPRTIGSDHEWCGGTDEEHACLKEYYQVFVDTVRASGGNNGTRVLMINTFAASAKATAINGLIRPNDTAPNKLIVSIHAYVPDDFARNKDLMLSRWNPNNTSDTQPIIEAIDRAYNAFVSKGIPVVMSEFGAPDKKNESDRAQYAKYYVSYAWSKGIKCVWWDNCGGDDGDFTLLDRCNNTIKFPALLKGIMAGIGNTGGV